MKRLTKITFTVTSEDAATLANAINFFRIGCTKATAENHDGEKEPSPENMAALGVTPEQLVHLIDFRHWILDEIADLEAWNAEVEHFEKLAETCNQK